MFDIAWSELALIGAVALIVIGPKDLPKVMRVMGQWTRKARLLTSEFQHNFDELVRQAELDEVRRQVQAVNPEAIKAKVENMIDPKAIEAALKIDPAATPAVAEPTAPAPSSAAPEIPAPGIAAPDVSVPVPVVPEAVASSTAPAADPLPSAGDSAVAKPVEQKL
ncbi:Sec-independent protein translocase protein TatB [Telmatospirillum sp.]|uniref:Sec-independent protein translocase protein TatB n=1 Tax=Telmatospirillum sp. TaxID=2079197 RepID=UPI0028428F66|nr:Sec-independent protein translocase protein TatB [Telmatospirillum sp.]MDR3435995.1 Sec-independent protein translocase protein TatB [Telmatospirillum sp.]